MTNQSTDPHSKISIRLSICNEFLLDEKKSIKKAYKSLIGKLGENFVEFAEFEYWFKKFLNNQFDLGYGKRKDPKIKKIETAVLQSGIETVALQSGIEIPKRNAPKVVDRDIEVIDENWPRNCRRSTVPHSEISIRLSVCNEFLLDEKKSIMNAYKSLIGKLGENHVEYTEFEYWFKRFLNNQFDLGYDKSQDSKENSEIPRETGPQVVKAEKETPILNKIFEFTDENLPQLFKKLVEKKKGNFNTINLSFGDSSCWLDFDELRTRFDKKKGTKWSIRYQKSNESSDVLKSNPEKFIVDHLWFVLKNLKIQLTNLTIEKYNSEAGFIDFKKFDFILKSMFNSFEHHQIHLTRLYVQCFNVDTFFSVLNHLKPETLEEIHIKDWEEGNFAKWKEIVELEQWKHAKTISSPQHTPLTIDNVLHCKSNALDCRVVTPEDVVREVNLKPSFRRSKKNQFDLSYHKSQDSKKISEIPGETDPKILGVDEKPTMVLQSEVDIPKKNASKIVEVKKNALTQFVDKNTEFTDQNLPPLFKKLVNKKKDSFNNINLSFGDSCCWLDIDDIRIRYERKGEPGHWGGWIVKYRGGSGEKNQVLNWKPEKFIVDHLWFVLKNPKIQLKTLTIEKYNSEAGFMNFKKFDFILKSMFNSFEHHQIHLTRLHVQCFNVDTFYSILNHLKPETLEEIHMKISEEGNFAKWKEIVELEQWKRAKTISSPQYTPLTIDNVLHCKSITLACREVTTEDVVRVKDHFLDSSTTESCALTALDEFMDHDEIEKALRSGDLILKITRSLYATELNFRYEIPNSDGFLNLTLSENKITFGKSCK